MLKLWVYINHDIITILLWSVSTINLQARVLATTVGFTKQLAKTLVLFTHNILWVPTCVTLTFTHVLRVFILSYLAWGLQHLARLQSFFNSILVMYSWIGLLPKISRILELSQGKFLLEHWVYFQQLKHMEPLSFDDLILLVPEILKFQNYYPWLQMNRHRLTRMHTMFL
jgi:hypothetical protein